MSKITPFLWFDNQAEEAANFYTSIFKNSNMGKITRYNEASAKASGRQAGSVMTIAFELDGQNFAAINGGPVFKFNESVSFVVNCNNQQEVDYYWDRLSQGGDVKAQQCGWLKDKYGLSWQVVPSELMTMLNDADKEKAQRVMEAMLQMKKIDLNKLKEVYDSVAV